MATRSIITLAALVLAVLMISAAFLFSSPHSSPTLVSADGNEELLREYAEKDTDADGLLDWEETLYNTDPNNPHSHSPDMTDGEAVRANLLVPVVDTTEGPTPEEIIASLTGIEAAPGTITREFARKFFSKYFASRANVVRPTSEEIAQFISTEINALKAETAFRPAYSASDAITVATTNQALRAYVVASEQVLRDSDTGISTDALDLFSGLVKKDDASAAEMLKELGRAYKNAGDASIKVSAPSSITIAHVALANAFAHMGDAITNMGYYGTDPLRGFLGLSQYNDATVEITRAFGGVGAVLEAGGVIFSGTEPGAGFYFISLRAAEGVAAERERLEGEGQQ